MSVLFISDLHLSENAPHLHALWQRFLRDYADPQHQLYILGDFFDVWLGDDCATEYQCGVIEDLRRLSDAGMEIYVQHGNRDFLLGETFAEQARVFLIPDPFVIDVYGEAVLLKHGDDLCSADQRHQWYRKFSRHPWAQRFFQALPKIWRQRIANKIRQQSRGQQVSALTITDAQFDAIKSALQQAGTAVLIHGHTHRPGLDHYADNTTRHILSDWGPRGHVLIASGHQKITSTYF